MGVRDPKENRQAFEIFDSFLASRQSDALGADDFDIRAFMLDRRFAEWKVGYVRQTMENSYGANLSSLFPNARSIDDPDFARPELCLALGTIYHDAEKSHPGAAKALLSMRPGDKLVLFEQGFLASSHSWSEAFSSKDPMKACLGYVYDDVAHYFMADYPNRLIHKLNSGWELSPGETARARALIDRIVAKRISKYNSQPILKPTMSEGRPRRVMVIDQAFADASTYYGKVDETDFEQMLLAALRENPDAEVLVKTHPDTFWEKGKRTGYYNHLRDVGRVRILREPVNPFCIFDEVDTVYVGTSQMGLEALFAGKKVVTFGAPFYAGWGLTDDRQEIPHRKRARSLEDLFHAFYIWYTLYHVPGIEGAAEVEDALDFIEAHRPVHLPEAEQAAPEPLVSVILPVHGVEDFIAEALRSIQGQTLRELEIITVNDRSPDGSQAIIDRMAAEDPRIRPMIMAENVGQGFARNAGIEAARGEYILFLDSDDYLAAPDVLERALKAARRDGADMLRIRKSHERVEDEEGRHLRDRPDGTERNFALPFHGLTLDQAPQIGHGRHFWTWLYRREFMTEAGIRFDLPQWEERSFLVRALSRAQRLSSIPLDAFVYRVRAASTARRAKTMRDVEMQLQSLDYVIDALEEVGGLDRASPLRGYAELQLTEMLVQRITGFPYEVVAAQGSDAAMRAYLQRLADAFLRADFRPDDLSDETGRVSVELRSSRCFQLILAALRIGRFDLVERAAVLKPFGQEELIEALLHEPQSEAEEDLQIAIGYYARNERVKTASGAGRAAGAPPRLIVHVGATKTGSTFIQHFLERNRAALLRRGVYVPEKGVFWQQTRPHKQAGHAHFAAEAARGGSELKDHVEAALALAGGRIHTVILSSEAFFLNPRSPRIAGHFKGWPCEMLVYLRRQDEWANSQYAEFVAGGAVGRVSDTVEEWLADPVTRGRLDYRAGVEGWAAVIGRENVHLRVYDRSGFPNGDVVEDMLVTLGLDALLELPRPSPRQANDFPFNALHVEMIRPYNALTWPDRERYFAFIDEIGREVARARARAGAPQQPVEVMDAAMREEVMELAAAGNAALAREYLGREDGMLFAPAKPRPPVAPSIGIEEIRAIEAAAARWVEPEPIVAQGGAGQAASAAARAVAAGRAPRQGLGRIDIRRTLTYRAFSLAAAPLISSRKRRKFEEQPVRFFLDAQNPVMSGLGALIALERGLGADPTLMARSPNEALRRTLTARALSKAGARMMSPRKQRKLERDPAAFLADMRGRTGRIARSLALYETGTL